jgi:hypothetical protein
VNEGYNGIRHTQIAVNKLVKDAINIAFDNSTAAEALTIREKRKPQFKGK